MKISIAMTEENGPPEYGSVIAHCTLQIDDGASPLKNTEAFQHSMHSAIATCCRAVHDELQRQREGRCAKAGLRHGAAGLEVEE